MRKKTPLLWLSRSECAALRGLAILCIVLHNFCHWTGCAVQENEYLFKASNAGRMWDSLMEPDSYLPVRLFSFFGHYGVQIFVVLSGYGLTVKALRMMEERGRNNMSAGLRTELPEPQTPKRNLKEER